MSLLPAAIAAYILVNAVAFLAYYRDKRLAEKAAWRTPESRLLALALIGPFGAFAAMQAFRHKTQKPKFRLVPLFVCLHLAIAAAFVLELIP
ncbi:DUF1294 domain-containing protein [Methanoculleus sp.]|uniref:DUF1294 domain-containing protein n=1 Tax=Methanoculleus sp. TaxID=90427 RepID=UPI002FCA9B8E